ncbi:SGNH/GDSL hydrolase family protein [Serratia sp. CY68630]|uniref:SGNH/GDSL hydrolase family protein n=1 Tax=Serratia sp. CY68630 TaxID=3383666 RepID=UPI003FA088B1
MTTYNTGNPVGSTDPRDLYDNTQNLDNLLLGDQHSYPDRLNTQRVTWSGIEYKTRTSGAAMGFSSEEELLSFTPPTPNVLAQDTSTGLFYYWDGTSWNKSAYQPTLEIITPYRLGLFNPGKNLYNYKTSIDGKFIDESGTISDNSNYTLSTYIEVDELLMYISSTLARFVSFFDKNRSFIGYAANQLTFNTPAGCKFVRLSIAIQSKQIEQLEMGGSRTVYEQYVDSLRTENNDLASISLRSAMGFKVGKNKFNKNLAMQGFFINENGVIIQSAAYCTSDYIPVIGGSDYRANQQLRSVVFYDVDKVLISGSLDVSSYFAVPMNAAYIRCSVLLDRIAVTQVEFGRNLTTFEPFGIAPPMALDSMPVAFPRQHVGPDDVGIFEPGKNIFNPYTLSNGFIDEWGFYNPDGSSYRVSDYIVIEPGVIYVSNKQMRFATFYDANKAFISTTAFIGTFTSPVNSAYARITVTIASSAGFQLEKGAVATEYEEYHYGIKPNLDNGTPIVIDSTSISETPDYFGLERLRETHMRLSKLTWGESIQFSHVMIGDSYTRTPERYPLKVAQKLWHLFNNTEITTRNPPIGFGYRSFGFNASIAAGKNSDIVGTDVVATGFTCAYNAGSGLDISSVSSSTAGSTITWSDNFALGFTYSLYAEGGSGVISYNAPGMSTAVQIDLSTYTAGMQIIPLSSMPMTGSGTATITVISGAVTLYGVMIGNATSAGVVVHKLGGSGASSANWTNADAVRWKKAFTTLKANLTTIMLGTNDQGAKMAPEQFKSNLLEMINRIRSAQSTTDILLICPAENNRPGGNEISMSAYARQMYEIAVEQDVAFLNLQQSFGVNPADYAAGSARPWMVGDGLHPAPETGGHAIASAIIRALKLPL